MSACTLNVQFDRADRRFVLGEKTTGTIEVQVGADCHCKALKAASFFKAYGHMRWSLGTRDTKVLFEGDWQAGHTYRYPFEFDLTKGPLTFHGEHFNIDWFVEAKAELVSALDTTAQEQFVVECGDQFSRVELPAPARTDHVERLTLVKAVAKMIGSVVIGLPGVVVLVLALRALAGGQYSALLGVIAGAVFAVAGIALGIRGVHSLWGTLALKVLSVSVEPSPCRAGDDVRMSLTFAPRRSRMIKRVVATLKGEEIVIRRGGTYEHVIHRDEQQIHGSLDSGSGQPVTVAGRFAVPNASPHSFLLGDGQDHWEISWTIGVRVELNGHPDWKQDYRLIVSP